MRTIRLIIWLCLMALPAASHCYAQDIQYYWVKPNKVFLWKSAEDTKPVTATLEPSLNWTITPNDETGSWQRILEDIAHQHYSTLKLDDYKKEDKLLALMLTKLHNDYPNNIQWAKLREPFAQIFWQSEPEKTIQIVFLKKDAPATQNVTRSFTSNNNIWQKKGGDIDLKTLLNVTSDPTSLRTVFNLPNSAAAENDWDSAWDDFANANFQGDQVRPITYQDKDSNWQWIWWENKGSGPLPAKYTPFLKPPLLKEPVLNVVEPEPKGMTWAEIIRVGSLIILVSVLITLTLAAFIKRRELWKYVSTMIGDGGKTASASTDSAIISADVLDLLHQHAVELVQGLPQQKGIKSKVTTGQTGVELNEAGRNHLIQVLSWTHEQYLKIISSDQFRNKVASLEEKILEAHYKEIGLNSSDADSIAGWIVLGRTFETKIKNGEATSSSFVKTIIKQKYPDGLKSREDWMESWPKLLNDLGQLAEKQQSDLKDVRDRLEKAENNQQSEKNKIEQDVKAKWEAKIKSAEGELAALTTKYNTASSNLEKSQRTNESLQAELKQIKGHVTETTKGWQEAQNSLTKYQDALSEIQEVKNLSRDLRQWIQGYFVKQQHTGDMRSVGLMAALVNYSLYQVCFSILEDHRPMRKAMAQNLLTLSHMFNKNANYSAVLERLRRIDPKVETEFDEPTNPAGRTIDDPLFQACLRSLQTDTGFNLGPFFIDETEEKINLVNAS